MIDELERMWKKTVAACLKIFFRHANGSTRVPCFNEDSRSTGQVSDMGTPEYKVTMWLGYVCFCQTLRHWTIRFEILSECNDF
jgi:hypothetical protein